MSRLNYLEPRPWLMMNVLFTKVSQLSRFWNCCEIKMKLTDGGISQTYQEIQSCHWHDNNWEIGEGTPNHWPSEHYSLFVALATFLAVWSWREWHHRTSSRDDLQPYGKAPIVASTLLMSRSHWHHGICMSLSCFGWLPGKRRIFCSISMK